MKISMLKRQIEKEFTDVFPKEPTYICGKLEDQYGYALSNSSQVHQLLKYGDRITVYPDDIVNTMNNPSSKDGFPELHTSNDISEILFLLRNVQQSLSKKLAGNSTTFLFTIVVDSDIQNAPKLEEILLNVTPMGFTTTRAIIHNVAIVMTKAFSTERLQILEGKLNSKLLNMVVTVLNFWIGEFITHDQYLFGYVINILEILIRSGKEFERRKCIRN